MKRNIHLFFMLVLVLRSASIHAQESTRYKEMKEPVLTKPPVLRKFVEAEYPKEALSKRIQGDVLLLLDVDENGKVVNVQVLKGAGYGFDESAVNAAKQFEFEPAEVDKVPAPVRIEYVYHFRLEEVETEAKSPARCCLVKGRVREKGTLVPVPFASVFFHDISKEVTTDEKGRFEVEGVQPGFVSVTVKASDYKPLTTVIEVIEGRIAETEFMLEPLEQSQYMTIVRGEREKQVVTRYSATERQLTTVPGTFGDPARVVMNLPGISRSPYILGLLLVRGSYPEDSLVFVDGVEIPLLYHFMGGPSVLNPEFLKRIDFYPGNFSVQYGRATAGIIEVETDEKPSEVWRGVADINMFHASLFLGIPIKKSSSLRLALRRSYYDAIIPLMMRASGSKGTSIVPVYYDYQARFDTELKGNQHLAISAFGSHDSLDLATTEEEAKDAISLHTRQGFHRFVLRHKAELTKNLHNSFLSSFGYDPSSMDLEDSSLDVKVLSALVREEIAHTLKKFFSFKHGLDFLYLHYGYSTYLPVTPNYITPGETIMVASGEGGTFFEPSGRKEHISRSLNAFALGAYSETTFSPVSYLKIIPGLRLDSYFYLGRSRFTFDPRLVIRFFLGKGVTLKTGAGIFHKLPADYKLDPQYGNPDLGAEWAEQYSLGVEWRFLKRLTLDVQGFFVRRHDLAQRSDRVVQTTDGTYKRLLYENTGSGRAYGMELLLKHDLTERFYGWISYTLMRSEEKEKGSDAYVPSRFDQTHILTIVASGRPGMGFEVGIRFRLVSGNPETPVFRGEFVADRGFYLPIIGPLRSARGPLFHQLDLRVEKMWRFTRWMLSLYLDIQNIYNAKNPELRMWDYRFKKTQEIRGLPFLPSLGIKGVF